MGDIPNTQIQSIIPIQGNDVIQSEWDKHGLFNPQQQIRVRINGDFATVQVFEQNVVEWLYTLLSQTFGDGNTYGHVLEHKKISITEFKKEDLQNNLIKPLIDTACHEQANRINTFHNKLRLQAPKEETLNRNVSRHDPSAQPPIVTNTHDVASNSLNTPSSTPLPAVVTTLEVADSILLTSIPTAAPSTTPGSRKRLEPEGGKSVKFERPSKKFIQPRETETLDNYTKTLEDLSLNPTLRGRVKELQVAIAELAPYVPLTPTTPSPSRQSVSQTLASPNLTLPQTPRLGKRRKIQILPQIFNAPATQTRQQKIAAIGQQIVEIQLQDLIEAAPVNAVAARGNFKAALIESAGQAVRNTPADQTTIKMTQEQSALVKLLAKLMEEAKKDFPQERQALEGRARAMQQSTLQALTNALAYRQDENFDARFSLEMGSAADQLFDNLSHIQSLYQAANMPLPGSTAHKMLHSEPVQALVTAVDTLALTFPQQKESLQLIKNNLLTDISKTLSAVQGQPLNDSPAALRIKMYPLIERFVTELNVVLPIINREQGHTLAAHALPPLITSPAEQAETITADIVAAYKQIEQERQINAIELEGVYSPPTAEETIRSAVSEKIKASENKIYAAFKALKSAGKALGNNDTIEFVHMQRKLQKQLDAMKALKEGYNPSWLPFTRSKQIDDLSLSELQNYQAHVDKQLKAIENSVIDDLTAIQSVSAAIETFEFQLDDTFTVIGQLKTDANGQKPQILAAKTLTEVLTKRLEKIHTSAKFLAEDEADTNMQNLANTIDEATVKLANETAKLQDEDAALSLKKQLAELAPDSAEAAQIRQQYVKKIEDESEAFLQKQQSIVDSWDQLKELTPLVNINALKEFFNTKIKILDSSSLQATKLANEGLTTIEKLQAYRNAMRAQMDKQKEQLSSLDKALKDVIAAQKNFTEEVKVAEEFVPWLKEQHNFIYSHRWEEAVEGAKQLHPSFQNKEPIDSIDKLLAFTNHLDEQIKQLRAGYQVLTPLEQLEIDDSTNQLTPDQRQTLTKEVYAECRSQLAEVTKIYKGLAALVTDEAVKECLPKKGWAAELRETIERNLANPTQIDEREGLAPLKEVISALSTEVKEAAELQEKYADLPAFAKAAKEHHAALTLARETAQALKARPTPQHAAAQELERLIEAIEHNRAEDMVYLHSSSSLETYAEKLRATDQTLELTRLAALVADSSLPEQLSQLVMGTAEYEQALRATVEPQLKALGAQAAILENAITWVNDLVPSEKFVFSADWMQKFNEAVSGLRDQIDSLQKEFDTGWVLSNKQQLTQLTPDQVKAYQTKVGQTLTKSAEVNTSVLAELQAITDAYTRYKEALDNAQTIATQLEDEGYSEIAEPFKASIHQAISMHVQAKRGNIYSITRTHDQPLFGGTPDHISTPDAYPAAVEEVMVVLDNALSEVQAQHAMVLEAKQLADAKAQAKAVRQTQRGRLENMEKLEKGSHAKDLKNWNGGEYINYRKKIIADINSSITALVASETGTEKRTALQHLEQDIATNAGQLNSADLSGYINRLEKLAE